ncbi:alpha/beta fold hydrolase [Nocardiopsis coralliicola]
MAYDRAGSGTPVVLLHGLGHRRQAWTRVIRALGPGFDAAAPDLPGFGATPPPPPGAPYDVAALADTVAEWADGLGWERPHLVGNSLGGAIALELARRGRAASVTLFSPVGFADPGTRAGMYALAAGAGAASRVPAHIRQAVAASPPGRSLARRALRGDPKASGSRDLVFDASVLNSGSAFVRLIPEIARHRFSGPVHCPVTVGWGDRDRLLRPSNAVRALRLIPHARTVILLGCGHIPMADAPGRVAAEIRRTANRSALPASADGPIPETSPRIL